MHSFSLIALAVILIAFVIFFYSGKPRPAVVARATQSQTDVAKKLLDEAESGNATATAVDAGSADNNKVPAIPSGSTTGAI